MPEFLDRSVWQGDAWEARADRRLLDKAAQRFHEHLLHVTEGSVARGYLRQRGINDETIGRFQLGCARDEWQDLSDFLSKKGFGTSEQADAGLVIERDGGGYYDRFRDRVMFPIRSNNSRPRLRYCSAPRSSGA